MTPTITYLRVSTAKQEVMQQDLLCQRWCKAQAELDSAWANPTTVTDTDISGTKPFHERPGGLRILQAAQRSDFQRLVVAKVDRLGRNTEDVLSTVRKLESMGVATTFLDLGTGTHTPMGKFMLTVMAACAEMERNRTVERIQDRFEAKRATRTIPGSWGEMCGKDAPFGWQPIQTERTNRKGNPIYELIIEPNEIQHLETIINLRYGEIPQIIDGKLAPQPEWKPVSWPKIANYLNSCGITTKQGKQFCGGVVAKYASNKLTRLYVEQEILTQPNQEEEQPQDDTRFAPGEEEEIKQLMAI